MTVSGNADFEKKLSEIRKGHGRLLKTEAPLNKVDVLAKDIMELMVGRNVVYSRSFSGTINLSDDG